MDDDDYYQRALCNFGPRGVRRITALLYGIHVGERDRGVKSCDE